MHGSSIPGHRHVERMSLRMILNGKVLVTDWKGITAAARAGGDCVVSEERGNRSLEQFQGRCVLKPKHKMFRLRFPAPAPPSATAALGGSPHSPQQPQHRRLLGTPT